jgi:hypothetical protein
VVVVAGGDGTQALVAGIAAARNIPMMVISAGTRNHFALDLNLGAGDRPAEQADDPGEQEHERQVGERGQRGRGEKIAQPLELAQVAGEGARRGGARFHAHAERLAEQLAR